MKAWNSCNTLNFFSSRTRHNPYTWINLKLFSVPNYIHNCLIWNLLKQDTGKTKSSTVYQQLFLLFCSNFLGSILDKWKDFNNCLLINKRKLIEYLFCSISNGVVLVRFYFSFDFFISEKWNSSTLLSSWHRQRNLAQNSFESSM